MRLEILHNPSAPTKGAVVSDRQIDLRLLLDLEYRLSYITAGAIHSVAFARRNITAAAASWNTQAKRQNSLGSRRC